VSDPAVLAQSARASVCAPAGYGKTHLIGHALLAGPDKRHLVLTHTHAGVHAVRKRLTLLGVPKNRYRIDTIAGWALQYAQAFPTTTHYTKPAQALQEDWPNVYNGVAELLRTSPANAIVTATYVGVYVDEYQDCSLPQHALITALANLIPCRVLGDPLQAIFDFAEPTVDWHNDVIPAFPALPPLTQPHRWRHDPALAAWLQQARITLENRQPLSLRNGLPAAVRVLRRQTYPERNRAIQQTVNQKRTTGRTVVITQWPHQCHQLARQTPGVYVLEPVDGADFTTAATQLSAPTGADRVNNILAFAATCFTGFDQQQQQRLLRAAQGTTRVRSATNERQIAALKVVHDAPGLAPIPEALAALAHMDGVRVTRPELYTEIKRAFVAFREGGHETIHDALAATRQRTRQAGRALSQQTMGRTLLIKGLEFEHAILIAPEDLNTQNLYVAITRGTHSLTIITNADTLHPGH
jgi:UvrD/REP helicase N-terminal domain